MRLPPYHWRAKPWGPPDLGLMFTGDDMDAAGATSAVASNMFGLLRFGPADLPWLVGLIGNITGAGGTQVNGHLLSLLGFQFANEWWPPSDYYIDSAFTRAGECSSGDAGCDARLFYVLPQGSCERFNLTHPMAITDVIVNYFSALYPYLETIIRTEAARLAPPAGNSSGGSSSGGGGVGVGADFLSSILLGCTDAIPVPEDSQAAINDVLYCGWADARCNGTVDVSGYVATWDFGATSNASAFQATFMHNRTARGSRLRPRTERTQSLLNTAVRGWVSTYLEPLVGAAPARSVELLGLMSFPKPATAVPFNIADLLGPLFFCWVIQLLLPTFLSQLVYEKEKRLRMMMKMHGLGDATYWLVTYVWFLLLYCVYMAVFLIIGSLLGLGLFVRNSYGIQRTPNPSSRVIMMPDAAVTLRGDCDALVVVPYHHLHHLWQRANILLLWVGGWEITAYLYVLAVGLIGSLLMALFFNEDYWWCPFVELVPGWALYRCLHELNVYSMFSAWTQSGGMTFAKLSDPSNGTAVAWAIMLVEWPFFLAVAYYLEQVLPSGVGARRHWLFCLPAWARGPWRARDAAGASPLSSDVEAGVDAAGRALLPRQRYSSTGLGAGAAADRVATPSAPLLPPHGQAVAAAAAKGVFGLSADSSASASSQPEGSSTASRPGSGSSGTIGRPGAGVAGAGIEGENVGIELSAIDIAVAAGSVPGGRGSGSGGGPRAVAEGVEEHAAGGVDDGVGGVGGGGGGEAAAAPAPAAAAAPAAAVAAGAPAHAAASAASAVASAAASGAAATAAATAVFTTVPAAAAAAAAAADADAAATAAILTAPAAPPTCTDDFRPPPPPAVSLSTPSAGVVGAIAMITTAPAAAPACKDDFPPPPPADAMPSSAPPAGAAAPTHHASVPRTQTGRRAGLTHRIANFSAGHYPDIDAEAEKVERILLDADESAAAAAASTAAGAAAGAAGAAANGGGGSAWWRSWWPPRQQQKEQDQQQQQLQQDMASAAAAAEPGGGGGGVGVGSAGGRGDGGAVNDPLRRWPVVVQGLAKTFDVGGDERSRHAVRELSLAVEAGECFGLLGPNGAGKTTVLNMLVGFLKPSSGRSVVAGLDTRSRMPEAYRHMGVCPQDNLLWESLTAREHLRFFGRLKGLSGTSLESAVTATLVGVRLGDSADRPVGKFSGGMKRRLSVAISFMGSPKVIYLDEPSTGLDPASRRQLWNVVRSERAGRVCILTTHSMEEAEVLCDRLGIFVDGRLVCIGNPKEIKARYAGYLNFNMLVPLEQEAAAMAVVADMSPGALLTYCVAGLLKYELPTTEVSISGVFSAMATAKACLTVIDWGVASATLEEVFIKLARTIGANTGDFQ
ncbi:hypothetical protein FOA52_014773 [Chlamydomonas sp. UWO 241]|nr:hypothetical protein FOA52_014773 [Chlamydomonas sp. UWO 241]